MTTECNGKLFEFHPLGRRQVCGRISKGGEITSDAEGLLLREVEKRTGIIERFADCFTDHRDPERIEHTVRELSYPEAPAEIVLDVEAMDDPLYGKQKQEGRFFHG